MIDSPASQTYKHATSSSADKLCLLSPGVDKPTFTRLLCCSCIAGG